MFPSGARRFATATSDRISNRGGYHSDPHILGEIHACVVGKHAAVSNSNSQFAAPDLAHADLVAHALDAWLDVSPELDLADADGAALSRLARPAKPIADDLPHGIQTQTSRHHG